MALTVWKGPRPPKDAEPHAHLGDGARLTPEAKADGLPVDRRPDPHRGEQDVEELGDGEVTDHVGGSAALTLSFPAGAGSQARRCPPGFGCDPRTALYRPVRIAGRCES